MAGPRWKIALMLPEHAAHGERILRGIGDYARRRTRWVFVSDPERFDGVEGLRGWKGDGIIALVNSAREERVILDLGIPAVNFSGALRRSRVPRVMLDSEAAGRVAAEHLLACGFPGFACYGLEGVGYAEARGRGFAERLRAEGLACSVHQEPRRAAGAWSFDPDRLEAWLAGLRKPVGVFACTDRRARLVLEACERLRIAVPGEAGLIGVDNDVLACEFCRPTLTSVARNDYALGVEIARLLDCLLRGGAPPPGDVLVAPGEVVARASTDVLAVEHPELRRALRFIRGHLGRPFGVEDVLRPLGVSRRTLEALFRRRLRCPPRRFIERARLERARRLLLGSPPRSLKEVACACGFGSARHLRRVFRRLTGMTPREYRRAAREEAVPGFPRGERPASRVSGWRRS